MRQNRLFGTYYSNLTPLPGSKQEYQPNRYTGRVLHLLLLFLVILFMRKFSSLLTKLSCEIGNLLSLTFTILNQSHRCWQFWSHPYFISEIWKASRFDWHNHMFRVGNSRRNNEEMEEHQSETNIVTSVDFPAGINRQWLLVQNKMAETSYG